LLVSVSSSEIALKGENRPQFESLLIKNIRSALSGFGKFRVQRGGGRVLIYFESEPDQIARESVKTTISKVFGIDSISFPLSAKLDIIEIQNIVLSNSGRLIGKKIRVETRRSDKRFSLKSQEVNQIIGQALVDAGCKVDLDNPEETIFIEILSDRALIYFDRLKGPGGLPVGSSGKVISLLSGGIDSPVATWLMLKRGCVPDLLHLHQFPNNADIGDSKIIRLVKIIRDYSPTDLKLFSAPYTEFYKKSISMNPKSELVLFRRFLFHLTNALAIKYKYKGVVTGDSVGQVASQTIDNIFASDEASQIPVFRPLVGFNKQEIVDLAIEIGTYKTSIEAYKDCCSLVAQRRPSTKVPLELVKKLESELSIESIVEKTIEQVEVFEI
jgi:thiamine biosynthesis protein ThiI